MIGLTRIEIDYMKAVENINRKMKDQREIDWEARRYEIARDVMCVILNQPTHYAWDNGKELASISADFADALINELKKGGDND